MSVSRDDKGGGSCSISAASGHQIKSEEILTDITLLLRTYRSCEGRRAAEVFDKHIVQPTPLLEKLPYYCNIEVLLMTGKCK